MTSSSKTGAFITFLAASCMISAPAVAAEPAADSDLAKMKKEIDAQKAIIDVQRRELDRQKARLDALDEAILSRMRATGAPSAQGEARSPDVGVKPVGQPPAEPAPEPQVAVLADQGGVITRAGRLTLEPDFEYARSDRNRVLFRGIEVPQSVLVGVFDINESRQDILTAALGARFGITNRFEINVKVPYLYRSDKSVLAPIVTNPPGSQAGTQDYAVSKAALGDIEFGIRYQMTDGTNGYPYLIAGVQAIAPTGTNPFDVPRDALGNATEAATGAGFWGVSPNLTVLMPSDPAVLFASIGYTFNFGRDFNTFIGDTLIEHVKPGGEPSATLGIGISLNPRVAVSFAYAHTWSIGTRTRSRIIDRTGVVPVLTPPIESTSRDLQLGRYMFGISYRASDHLTINWNVEIGATPDAANVRTTLRIPFTFDL